MTHPSNVGKVFFDKTIQNDKKNLKIQDYTTDTTPIVYKYKGAVPKQEWDKLVKEQHWNLGFRD